MLGWLGKSKLRSHPEIRRFPHALPIGMFCALAGATDSLDPQGSAAGVE
jgi:hypothetical protein